MSDADKEARAIAAQNERRMTAAEVIASVVPMRGIAGWEVRDHPAVQVVLMQDAQAILAALRAAPAETRLALARELMRDRQLDREDFDLQLEGARDAVAKGYHATARAMLNGALLILTHMEAKDG